MFFLLGLFFLFLNLISSNGYDPFKSKFNLYELVLALPLDLESDSKIVHIVRPIAALVSLNSESDITNNTNWDLVSAKSDLLKEQHKRKYQKRKNKFKKRG